MKKNKMMRTASGLLVATLLTTSIISGTFAKYTTTASGSDTARVAKWGVTITANGNMFASEYDTKDTDIKTIIAKSVVSNTTSGTTKDNVLAPGTEGNLTNATISGTPEVAVNVNYEPTLTLTGWTLENNTEYCPIVFKVNDTTYGLTGVKDSNGRTVTNESNNISELITAVQNAIKADSKNYAPNTDLSEDSVKKVNVSWEWAFEGNDDANDTYLGDQAAKGNAATISLTVVTTVTQID